MLVGTSKCKNAKGCDMVFGCFDCIVSIKKKNKASKMGKQVTKVCIQKYSHRYISIGKSKGAK